MKPSPDFSTLSTPRPVAAGISETDIPDGWQQGRGAFGGLVLASAVHAIRAEEPDEGRALRSLTAEIFGPVQPGPLRIHVEVLRRGNGVSTLAARLQQGGELCAHAVAVLGRTRVTDRTLLALAPPQLRPWRDVPVAPIAAPIGPNFAQFCEFRPTGPYPFSGAKDPEAAGWFRFRSPGPAWSEAELVAVADGYWPCVLAIEPAPRPTVTVAFTLQLLRPASALPREAPLFHRARTLAGSDGYVVEQRELWSEQGELVALNQQTFAIVK